MANNPTKTFYTRIQNKHDTATAWNSSTLVPYAGEIIVYDPVAKDENGNYTEAPRFKIGDGERTVPNLPFADDKVLDLIDDAIDQIGTSMANLKLGVNGQKTTLSYGSTPISEVTVPYATASGTASVANKLGTEDKGSATKGIYLKAGVPTAMTYELNETVPDGAIFTDENVKNTLSTTKIAYVTGTTSDTTNTGGQVFNKGVYLDTTAGQLVATTFKGALDGNAKTATEAGKVSKALTLKVNGANAKTYDGSAAVEFNVTASSLGLTNAMHFLGTSDTAITDGGNEKPTIGGSQKTPAAGDVVLYGGKEFVYASNSIWELLGDEGSYALKTVSITAEDGLEGGGDLSENIAIRHAVPSGAAVAEKGGAGKYISTVKTDKFGHITSFSEGTLPTLSEEDAGSGNAVTDISVDGHKITWTKGKTFALQSDLTNLKDKAVDSISEGTENGTIKYTVDGEDKGNVKVHGLGSAAFTASTDYAPSTHVNVSATSAVLGHVKLSDETSNTTNDASKGIAVSPKALATVNAIVSGHTTKISNMKLVDSAADGQFVTAVNQSDGKITVSRKALVAADIPNHASSATTYGIGTSSNYGHVKLTDSAANIDASNGIALSPKALHTYATGLNLSTLNENPSTSWVLFNCGTSDSVL